MAFCKYCGKEIKDYQKYCAYCGGEQFASDESAKQEKATVDAAPVFRNKVENDGWEPADKKSASEDKGGFGWGALGCCIPLAGLILYLVWKTDKPKNAKAAGIGALIGVIVNVVVTIISTAIGILSGL